MVGHRLGLSGGSSELAVRGSLRPLVVEVGLWKEGEQEGFADSQSFRMGLFWNLRRKKNRLSSPMEEKPSKKCQICGFCSMLQIQMWGLETFSFNA